MSYEDTIFNKFQLKEGFIEATQINEPFSIISKNNMKEKGDAKDWLMRNSDGEFFICKSTLFEKLFQTKEGE